MTNLQEHKLEIDQNDLENDENLYRDIKIESNSYFSFKKRVIFTVIAVFLIIVLGIIGKSYFFPKETKTNNVNFISGTSDKTPQHVPGVTHFIAPKKYDLYNGPFTKDLTNRTIKDSYGNVYKVVGEFARDSQVFTEGLSWVDKDTLLESSGDFNNASIHFLNLDRKNMKILKYKKHSLDGNYFGEGSDVLLDSNGEKKIFQLTWKAHKIFQYDLNLKKLEKTFDMTREIPAGWAITADWNDRSIAYMDTGDQ